MLESKRRAIIFLGLSFLLAIVAGFMFLQKVRALNADLGGMTEVYVAESNISSRAVIQPGQVTTMEIPNRYVTESYITSSSDLKDKVSIVPLSEGDIITKNMLKPVSNVMNDNNRLVTMFGSDKVSFDEELEALDRVDIIVSHNLEDKEKTETFMTDVTVARVAKEGKKFKGVQLEVSADKAPQLIHMQNYADQIRILKANVKKGEQQAEQQRAEQEQQQQQQAEQEKQQAEQEKKQQEAEKAKQAEQKKDKKEDDKKDEDAKKKEEADKKKDN